MLMPRGVSMTLPLHSPAVILVVAAITVARKCLCARMRRWSVH
jgi:hypothetical protein